MASNRPKICQEKHTLCNRSDKMWAGAQPDPASRGMLLLLAVVVMVWGVVVVKCGGGGDGGGCEGDVVERW